jgi:hypothetical protein
MTDLLDELRQAIPLLGDVARVDWQGFTDEDLLAYLGTVEDAGRRVDAARAQVAAEVDARSRRELGDEGLAARLGHAKATHLIEQHTRISAAEAARRVRVGAAIRPRLSLAGEVLAPAHPLVAVAVRAGAVGIDAAAVIIRSLDQAARSGSAEPEVFEAAEAGLVEAASTLSADLVETYALAWREKLDPDGAEPRFEEIREQRGVRIGRERNGITTTVIKSAPHETALLKAAMADSTVPGAIPRFMSDEDTLRGTELVVDKRGELVEMITDPRTREQKLHDIFFGVFFAGVRASQDGPVNMRATTQVNAVITLDDLRNGTGVGWLDDSIEPVPASVVQELACDAGFRTMLLGDSGEVLRQGFLQRYFTAAQRRALAVRDGGCVDPSCTAPPSWCHAHHVKFWENDGPTDVDNGVLLCPKHHHDLHQGKFEINMVNGKPFMRRPIWVDPEQTWFPVGRTRALLATAA